MKKHLFLLCMLLMSVVGAFAQASFETAVEIAVGENSSEAVEVGYYQGAYFKYHASEACVLTLQGQSLNFAFYNADQTNNYNSYSESKGTLYTYSIAVEANTDVYALITLSYGATATTVDFTASVTPCDFAQGLTPETAVTVEDGSTYWFYNEAGSADVYLNYTATADGVLKLHLESAYLRYGEGGYTVDGVETPVTKDDDKDVNVPVTAGKEYSIHLATYSKLLPVVVRFTQPQQGDTKDNPFILVMGENPLPAAAQKYYYTYTNGDKEGFLTLTGNGSFSIRTEGYSYDDLASGVANHVQLLLSPAKTILITLDKTAATAEDEVLMASFAEPGPGDLESTAIELVLSETEQTSSPVGTKYYKVTNNNSSSQFLNVAVDTEGVTSAYGATSTVKVYQNGSNPDWYGTSATSTDPARVEVAAGATYIVRVVNGLEEDIKFRAWFEAVGAGDLYSNPIALEAGDTEIAAGQKFYTYTPATTCKLTVKTDESKVSKVLFPQYDGDEYGRTLLSNENGEYVLEAQADFAYIIRITASEATTINVAEVPYGEGESRATAKAFDGTYQFAAPHKTWLVYEAPRAGVAEVKLEGIESLDYNDKITAYVDEALSGTELKEWGAASYVPKTLATSVVEGTKIYLYLDMVSTAEGLQIVANVRDANPGEAASNPLPLTIGEENPNELPYVGYYDNPIWFAFETEQAGTATFSAVEYVGASLFDSNMQQIKAGTWSDDMSIGGYYGSADVVLPEAGKYYLRLNSNSNESNTLTLTGSAFEKHDEPVAGATLWGNIIYSDKWTQSTEGVGMYAINPAMANEPQMLMKNVMYLNSGTGYKGNKIYGIYADFSYYATYGWVFAYGTKIDTKTWTTDYDDDFITDNTLIATETATDYATETTYGAFYNSTFSGLELGVIDYENRTRSTIGELNQVYVALGMASTGTLYGISINGDLYSINPATAEETLVGSTGLNPCYADGGYDTQSGEIDQTTDIFYWAAMLADGTKAMYTVNLATAEATKLSDLNYQVVGLTVAPSEVAGAAPGAATEFAANFTDASLTGTLSCVAPSVTEDGEELTGELSYEIKDGGVTVAQGVAQAGSNVTTEEISLAQGMHNFAVVFSNAKGNGPSVLLSKWIGYDEPTVLGVELAIADNVATATWTASAEGVHEGYVGALKYNIYRYTDGNEELVAEGTDVTLFSETLDAENMAYYSYAVVAINGDMESEKAVSNTLTNGEAYNVPYTASFSAQGGDLFDIYTVIDANQDYCTWMYSPAFEGATYYYSEGMDADDWLISPNVRMKAGQAYDVTVEAVSSHADKLEMLEVKMGNGKTAADMQFDVLAPTEVAAEVQTYTGTVIAAADGIYNVGIHAVSPMDQYFLIVRSLKIVENHETGISDITVKPATDERSYNIAGQRVSSSAKGIVIVNGKKYLNK